MRNRKRIDEFVRRLKRMKRENTIKDLCLSELDKLNSELSIESVSSYLSNYRTAIKSSDVPATTKKHALGYLKQSVKEKSLIKSKAMLAKRKRQANQKTLTANTIKKIIGKAVEMLKSVSYVKRGVGLCILTGRRPVEIFKTANMSEVESHLVLFSGQAKKRGTSTQSFIIPTLLDAKKITTALKGLRASKDFSKEDNYRVNRIVSKAMSSIVKKEFATLIGSDVKMYDFRSFYIEIVTQLYLENAQTSKSKTIIMNHLAGHDELETGTTQHYEKFMIPFGERITNDLGRYFTFNYFDIKG